MNSPKQTSHPSQGPPCQIEEALTYLRQLELFRDTPLEILKLYAYLSKKEKFTPGQAIVRQGEPAIGMYLIVSGSVSICETHGDTSYRLQELSANGLNYFGELALLAKFDWFFSAWADSETTLLSISREAFQKIMERFPLVYPQATEKIISLRINRFIDQTRKFIEKTDQGLWEKCPYS